MALLKYAKNPEGFPKPRDSFRIFLCIERGRRSSNSILRLQITLKRNASSATAELLFHF